MHQSTGNSDLNGNDVVVTFESDSVNPVSINVSYWEVLGANRHSG